MENRQKTPLITLTKNGPIKVEGSFILSNDKNEQINAGEELFLCRCGNSKNSPYCDGSHKLGQTEISGEKGSCD